ncbi:hypothetical protein JGU72_25945 [Antrihabitans sp. YC2-6]|nr:hypothetical protein [Antrihabitans sp. YC2-6]
MSDNIVIVGTGVTGATAAQQLRADGYTDAQVTDIYPGRPAAPLDWRKPNRTP